MKDMGILLGHEKKHREFFGYCTCHQLKSTIRFKRDLLVRVILGMLKNRSLLGRQINYSEVGIFWV